MPLKSLNVTWCVTPAHIISFVQLCSTMPDLPELCPKFGHMKFYPHISSISSPGFGLGSYNALLVTPHVHHILVLQGYSSEMDQ